MTSVVSPHGQRLILAAHTSSAFAPQCANAGAASTIVAISQCESCAGFAGQLDTSYELDDSHGIARKVMRGADLKTWLQ